MPNYKGRCKVDGKWREGSPIADLSGWVGIKIFNLEKGCYTVYEVYPETWKKVTYEEAMRKERKLRSIKCGRCDKSNTDVPMIKIPKVSIFKGKKIDYELEDVTGKYICLFCLNEIVLDAHGIKSMEKISCKGRGKNRR